MCETHSHGIDMDYSVLKKASKEEGREMMPSLIDRGKIADHFRFIIITLVLKRLRSEDKETNYLRWVTICGDYGLS